MFLIELRKTRNKYASISKLSWRNHNFSQNSMLSKRRTCESLNRSKFWCLCVGSGCILSFQVHLAYLGLVIHPASRRRSSSFVYKSALLIRDSSIFLKGTLRLSVFGLPSLVTDLSTPLYAQSNLVAAPVQTCTEHHRSCVVVCA